MALSGRLREGDQRARAQNPTSMGTRIRGRIKSVGLVLEKRQYLEV